MHVKDATVQTAQVIQFTGRALLWRGHEFPATCVVRNEVNRQRQPWQVVYTMGSTKPHGVAYYPRPFPSGSWEITNIADMGDDTVYWPTWIGTEATQELEVWSVDIRGFYERPTGEFITGRGYGIHHARYHKGSRLVPSNTTLGCINVLSPSDARELGEEIREARGYRQHVILDVPKWEDWD